jgi:hypothetical protein
MVPPRAPSFFASRDRVSCASRGSKFPFGGHAYSPYEIVRSQSGEKQPDFS